MPTDPSENERREYFRIDDTIRLSVRPVPEEELDDRLRRLEEGMGGNFTVMASLSSISAQMAASFHKIEGKYPEIADYLRSLDAKLEIIGKAFLTKDCDGMTENAEPVNISAGGLSVGVNEAYEVNSCIEVRMLLFPSFTGVLTYGTVIRCDTSDNENYDYELRIEFTHLREHDRDILIRHIMRRQGDLLRDRRAKLKE